jgi:hypothetical protein
MDAEALRQQRLERAILVMAGLAVGDALGDFFAFAGGKELGAGYMYTYDAVYPLLQKAQMLI